jgi:hypothetical protein
MAGLFFCTACSACDLPDVRPSSCSTQTLMYSLHGTSDCRSLDIELHV